MSAHENAKKALEEWAAKHFLPLYNRETGKVYALVKHQDRPDLLLVASDGTRLGLEVAHLYTDDDEAKILLGRSSDTCHGRQHFEDTLARLKVLLAKKEAKGRAYSCPYPLVLLIRSASPIFTYSDFMRFRDEIQAPRGVYRETWLPGDDQGAGRSRLLPLQ